MAKLSKTTKTVIIAAAVLLVAGLAVLLVLVMTSPEGQPAVPGTPPLFPGR